METLLAVRVRKEKLNYQSLDIKVTLYRDSMRLVAIGTNNDNIVWREAIYAKVGRYKDYTNLDFINDYISMNSRIENENYIIVQNPWGDNAPLWRRFGYDMYYLNNSTSLLIEWFNNGEQIGGSEFSDNQGNEINTPTSVIKKASIHTNDGIYVLDSSNKFSNGNSKEWIGVLDHLIIDEILNQWNKVYLGKYPIELCEPSFFSCSLIPYKPLVLESETPIQNNDVSSATPSKIPLTFVLNNNVLVKQDFSLRISVELNENVNIGEYGEMEFNGLDEEEFNIQEEVASGQLDSDSFYEAESVGQPIYVGNIASLDNLLRLAGQCAREVGKNSRVNYNNLRIPYKKGVHGLCPQGTFAVLYALTGVKDLGKMRGNANVYSFYQSGRLSNTYFNNKMKIGNDYITNPSMWQVGDIVACDYKSKPYGHIQIWTGSKWVSDHTQSKIIQSASVDFDTFALHRLNPNGLNLVQRRMVSI